MIEVFASWETELRTFWVAVATLVVLFLTLAVLGLTALYVRRQLRHAREERETAFVSEISTRWNEPRMEEARRLANTYRDSSELLEAINKFEEHNDRSYYDLLRIPAFFEDLGLVCIRDDRLIPLVRDLIGPSVKYYYELFSQWINKLKSDPTEKPFTFFKALEKRM